MKRPLSLVFLAFALPLIAAQAEANPIAFSSTGLVPVSPLIVPGGSFSEPGFVGSLNLNPSVPSMEQINTAQLKIGTTKPSVLSGGFDLSFNLTLGGITNRVTQYALWGSSPLGDAVLSFQASAPVQFGSWNVVLQPFFLAAGPSSSVSAPVMAQFADPSPGSPVPEPASIVLLATGLAGAGIGRWRKRRRSV